ncbi:FixH family protein [Neobacillus sp. PS3-40]|uniref:FixH family protein n=1 Tax=Neobacillus sp. PS3-40 TaxID=3070679 RepID=UPI0027E1A90D|nr:FixH family protein [Neobacillus sp. PS3-40]WML43792.1 SCO family protein [Neobacillus sp. PS3-40]
MNRIIVYIISLMLVFIAGCEGSTNLQVKLYTPKLFTPGTPYAMQFTIVDKQGTPVKGAKVSVNLNMKNMDHGTIPVTVDELGDGKYLGTANLSMNGEWLADIKVENGGKSFEEEKQFSVEVKTMENAHKVTKHVALPNFKLIDENGNTVTKQDLIGKTVVMTFTYVNCVDPNACPILLGNFTNLQQDLKMKGKNTDNLLLVSVSVDPDKDTPKVLKEHAQKMNFDLSYLKMLTGDLNEVKKLTSTLGVHFEKQGSVVMHDNKTFVFNQAGTLTHEFSGSYINRDELLEVVGGK